MNRKIALAFVIAAAITGNAFADDITLDTTPFAATRTRAEVQAELVQFRQSGVNPWSNEYNQLAGFASQMTRAQAVAEFIASREQVAAFNREDSGSSYLTRAHAAPAGATRVAGQPGNAE